MKITEHAAEQATQTARALEFYAIRLEPADLHFSLIRADLEAQGEGAVIPDLKAARSKAHAALKDAEKALNELAAAYGGVS